MGYRVMGHIGDGVQGAGVWGTCMGNEVQGYEAHRQLGTVCNGAHRQWGPVCNGYRRYGYMGNRAHAAIVYRGYGVQQYRPHGKWTMGHMGQ